VTASFGAFHGSAVSRHHQSDNHVPSNVLSVIYLCPQDITKETLMSIKNTTLQTINISVCLILKKGKKTRAGMDCPRFLRAPEYLRDLPLSLSHHTLLKWHVHSACCLGG